jgi:hypothetical protein
MIFEILKSRDTQATLPSKPELYRFGYPLMKTYDAANLIEVLKGAGCQHQYMGSDLKPM